MGICVSLNRRDSDSPPTVKIVSVNGDLREYDVPVLASQVLEAESAAAACSSSSYFICDSDTLHYDDFIPAVESEAPLHAEKIYFVLPISKRRNRLTAQDMAALAVKASVAIQSSVGRDFRRRKKGRISPIMALTQPNGFVDAVNGKASESTVEKGKPLVKKTAAFKGSSDYTYNRSGSVRNLRRHTSNRAKLAVRSFRLKLSTIHEGSDV